MALADQPELVGHHTHPFPGNQDWEWTLADDASECEHCSLYRWRVVQYPMLSSILEIPTEEGEENTPRFPVVGRRLPVRQLSLAPSREVKSARVRANYESVAKTEAASAAEESVAPTHKFAPLTWAELADLSVEEDEEAMETLLRDMVSKPSPFPPSLVGGPAHGDARVEEVAVSPSSSTGKSWADMLDDDEEEEAEALEAIRRELSTGRVSAVVEKAPEPICHEVAGVAPSHSWADMVEETEDEASRAMDALLSDLRSQLDGPAPSSEEVVEESAAPAPVGVRSPFPRPSGESGLLLAGIGRTVAGRPRLPSAARAGLSPAAMASAVAAWAR